MIVALFTQESITTLSCEIEGHPLGGGMLKIEPREAQRILLPRPSMTKDSAMEALFQEGSMTMRRWRHYSAQGKT
ncbi:MAG: hypothetical protein M1377_06140, partial [Deltaproteobacteria bacterium]|nr:hypothetical protein [Deltaproteobacteria bacterium]